jgi:hypothetical protein
VKYFIDTGIFKKYLIEILLHCWSGICLNPQKRSNTMKNICLLFILISTYSIPAICQFSKGQLFVNGTISVSGHHAPESPNVSSSSNSDGFWVSSSVGRFLNANYAVGVSLNGSTQKMESSQSYPSYTYQSHRHGFGGGIFVRRYFPITEKFMFYVHAGIAYGLDQSYQLNAPSVKTRSGSASVFPAFIFFPSKRWGVDGSIGSIGFTHYQYRHNNGKSKSNDFGLSAGNPRIGLSYYFSR